MLKVRDSGGTLRTVIAINIRDADNNLQTVTVGKVRDASSVLRVFFNSLAVALSATQVFGSVNTSRTVTVTTQAVTATPSGGAAPYSYSWALVSSSGGSWTINSSTSDTTTFTGGPCAPGDSFTGTFHCTVTDAVGNTVTTGNVTASVTNIGYNISGGGGPLP